MPLTAISGGSQTTKVIGNVSTGLFAQPLHPDVNAYIKAQASVGYALTRIEADAVNNLIWGMVGNGLWDKMQVVYPCIGNATIGGNSFKWNLKDLANFNLTFLGSWVFASTGMQVAAANTANRATTGYTPSVNQTLGDAHISVYLRNFYTAGTTAPIFGAYGQFANQGIQIGASVSAANNANAWVQNAGASSGVVNTTGYSGGMLLASRSTSLGVAIHSFNGGLLSTALGGFSNTLTGLQLTMGSVVTGGGGGTLTASQPQEISFATLGFGLSRIDHRNFYRIVQAYQTALGRQV